MFNTFLTNHNVILVTHQQLFLTTGEKLTTLLNSFKITSNQIKYYKAQWFVSQRCFTPYLFTYATV